MEAPRTRRRVALDPAWLWSAGVALAVRVVFVLVALGAGWYLAGSQGPLQTPFAEMWRRWDAHHLLTIAEHGYGDPLSDSNAAAFFPLYPLVVRAFIRLGLAPVPAGMLVSALASVVAGYYLYRLAEADAGTGAGRRAVLYMSLFPTAVFLVAPYSEALFIAGATAAFYYARTGRWELAGVGAAVATGSRAAGLFLLAGLVAEFFRQRDLSGRRLAAAALALLVGVLPVLAYGAFLAQSMGDPFEFLEAQRRGWGRDLVGPVDSFLATWRTWDNHGNATNWLLAWRVEIAAAALGVAATLWAALRREWGYAVFMGSFLAVLLSSSWYYSVPRMLLSMFPVYLLMASATRERDRAHEVLTLALGPLAALGVVVFTQGRWFY